MAPWAAASRRLPPPPDWATPSEACLSVLGDLLSRQDGLGETDRRDPRVRRLQRAGDPVARPAMSRILRTRTSRSRSNASQRGRARETRHPPPRCTTPRLCNGNTHGGDGDGREPHRSSRPSSSHDNPDLYLAVAHSTL